VLYNYEMIKTQTDELPGCSVFYKDENGEVFHTYSFYGRGNEEVIGAYMVLDMMPLGRNKTKNGNMMDWVKHHDEYEDAAAVKSCCA
jgi:predicted dithiol-disulfide oxidoreductase (DUF899 family)